MQEMQGRSLGREDRLEKEMATHSSVRSLMVEGAWQGYHPRGSKLATETTTIRYKYIRGG